MFVYFVLFWSHAVSGLFLFLTLQTVCLYLVSCFVFMGFLLCVQMCVYQHLYVFGILKDLFVLSCSGLFVLLYLVILINF